MASTKEEQSDKSTAEPSSRIARWRVALRGAPAWFAANRLKGGLAVGGGLLILILVIGAWLTFAGRGSSRDERVTLEMALGALDRGAYVEARELAERLRGSPSIAATDLGGPLFVLGATAAYEAIDLWGKNKKSHHLLAARYLEEARDRGFPPGREHEGLFLLGQSLCLSGQFPASRPVLHEALRLAPKKKTEIHKLLARAYLNDASPDLRKALDHNAQYLSDFGLSRPARDEGLLLASQILLQLNDPTACRQSLERISSDSECAAEATVIRGRLVMREAQELQAKDGSGDAERQTRVKQLYDDAIHTLREAQGRDTLASRATPASMYLIGECHRELGDLPAALEQLSRTRKLYFETPEGLAAGIREADVLRRMGRDDEAVSAYGRVLGAAGRPESYSNPWIALEPFRDQTLEAYQSLLRAGRFEQAVQLTERLWPIFPRARKAELAAQAHAAWAHSLLKSAEQLHLAEAETVRKQARAELRTAGQYYLRLAKLRIAAKQYPDDLWQAAECFLQGHDYRDAADVLREYLTNETRRYRPQALLAMGQSQLALGQPEAALAPLRECIDVHARSAVCFQARLVAAQAYLENGKSAEAEALLRENLDGDLLTPASMEWRESLFALGKLLVSGGRYEEAIRRLEEAVQRYSDVPQAIEGRYLLALASRQAAKLHQDKLKTETIESARIAETRQIQRLLQIALTAYEQIQEQIGRRQDQAEMNVAERAMLRNSYFAQGAALFDLGRYEESIHALSNATNRYQHEPEVLEAFVQIADCYRRLNKPLEARGTLEQAKMVLNRLNPDAPFAETTIYSRDGWVSLLAWLSSM